jgi:hypothetical protein
MGIYGYVFYLHIRLAALIAEEMIFLSVYKDPAADGVGLTRPMNGIFKDRFFCPN